VFHVYLNNIFILYVKTPIELNSTTEGIITLSCIFYLIS